MNLVEAARAEHGGVDDDCDGDIDEGQLNACGKCGPLDEEICDAMYESGVSHVGPGIESGNDIIIAQELLLKSIYQKALPSIVQVKVETVVSQRTFFGGLRRYNMPSEGTGFIWDENGYIVTNHHLIQNADTVRVIFDNETEFVAKVHGTDPHSDLAVLKINPGNIT